MKKSMGQDMRHMFSSFTLELCIKQQEKKSYATGREAYSWPSLQLTEHRVNFVTWLRRRWRRRKKISRNIFLKKDPVKNLVNDFVREIKNRVCFVKQNYQFRYPDSLAFHLLARSTSWWKKISAESRTKAKTLRLFLSLFISRMDEKLHLIYGLFLLLLLIPFYSIGIFDVKFHQALDQFIFKLCYFLWYKQSLQRYIFTETCCFIARRWWPWGMDRGRRFPSPSFVIKK